MLTSCVVVLHDNARPHTDARTQALLEYLNWELFDHILYSPDDLAESDYHLFHNRQTSLKQTYKSVFPNTIVTSIRAVTTMRSSLSMYVRIFYIYNKFFFFISCFDNTAHWKLLSE
jgi:hypothetical protein